MSTNGHHALHHHGPASPELAGRLRHQLVRWARHEGIPAGTTDDIGLACYEAMANIVTHAYPNGTVGPLELHARLVPGWVIVTVTDHGRWPDGERRAGYGLELIRCLSDDAEVVRGDYGTTVRMSWPRRAA
jgi:anti-sigma regulatory factor (Ser/Thr protein kinase)